MYRFLILVILFSSCFQSSNNEKTMIIDEQKSNESKSKTEEKQQISINSYDEEIDKYLSLNEIEPLMIINNNQDERLVVGEIKEDQKYQILNHKVQWKRNNGLEIIVNGHEIKEKPYTRNNVFGDGDVDNIGFANDVNQVKYYKLHDEADTEIIGFLLSFSPCTGKGCSVQYVLLYDVKKKKGTYFGDFRRKYGFELYSFGKSYEVKYLSQTYYENYSSNVDTFQFELYKHQKNGYFEPVINPDNREVYSFKHVHSLYEDTIPHSFEENWIEPIIDKK